MSGIRAMARINLAFVRRVIYFFAFFTEKQSSPVPRDHYADPNVLIWTADIPAKKADRLKRGKSPRKNPPANFRTLARETQTSTLFCRTGFHVFRGKKSNHFVSFRFGSIFYFFLIEFSSCSVDKSAID